MQHSESYLIEHGITVRQAAEDLGLRSYDTALPQKWVNRCLDRGFDPRGRFVVSYDIGPLGNLIPLSVEAAREIPADLIW